MTRLWRWVALAFVTLVAMAIPAAAGSILDSAGHALRSNSVYVAPGASPALTSDEASQLSKQIGAGKHPLFIAVLPEAVKNEVGTPDRLIPGLINATRLSGVYAAVAGPVFRAGETSRGGVPNAAPIADQVYQQDRAKGLYPMLSDFVHQVESAPVLQGGVEKKPSKPFPWLAVLLPIGLFLLLVAGIVFFVARRHRQIDIKEKRDDLLSQVYGLQSKINGYSASERGQSDYNAALDLVFRARERAESAQSDSDLAAASGLYSRAEAALAAAKDAEDVKVVSGTQASSQKTSTQAPTSTTIHKSELPEPKAKLSRSQNNYRSGYDGPISQSCYPGYGYGYYPGYGYGYIGFDGNFMMGMLEGELLADTFDDNDGGDTTIVNNDYDGSSNVDSGGGGSYDDSPADVDSGGGGDWGSSDSGSSDSGASYDSGSSFDSGGSDFGGGGGFDSGGSDFGGGDSGGGGDW